MNLNTQFELFLFSLFIGIYLGVTYDLLYYFIFMHVKKLIKYVFDLIFFVSQSFIVFNVIYRINYGIVPVYSYFLFAIGFLIYFKFSEKYYMERIYPLKKLLIRILNKLLKLFKYLFIKPLVDTYQFIKIIYLFLYKKFSKIFKGCGKIVKRKQKEQKTA
ncbi:MAG: hypothetical protein K0Q49_1377 [Haloplasmataceae bacterium]|jgi:spore cortex biosynthesis protein YabQ|nr:hypothetical protein [Haloplasmataceae bacterium]